MTDHHQPLPVQGYKPQSPEDVALANEGKMLEERVLRYISKIQEHTRGRLDFSQGVDERMRYSAIAKTEIQGGFMWAIRAIFNPGRAKLPEDE